MIKKRQTRGFTLIELLVVIAIIGTLVSVVLPNLLQSKAKSRDAKRASELKDLEQAVELYFQDNFKFPDYLSDLAPYYSNQVTMGNTDYKYNKTSSSYCLGAKMETISNSVSCDLGSGAEAYNYKIKGP